MKRITLWGFMLFVSLFRAEATEYTWTWTGAGGDGLFATTSNWSISPAADANTAAMGYPRNLSGHTSIAVFSGGASVTVPDVAAFFIQEIRIQSGTVSMLSRASGGNIEIGFDGVGLNINSGAALSVGGSAGIKLLMNATANNCTINGTLDLAGTGSSSAPPKLEKPNFVNPVWTVGSGGKIILSGVNASVLSTSTASLRFLSGSTLEVTRAGGTVPPADYQSGSLIKVTGNTSGMTAFSTSSVNFNGDIEWNCPLQSSTGTSASASLSSLGGNQFGGTFIMKAGYILFQGTLGGTSYFTNFNVQGGTVAFRATTTTTLAINGNIDVSGGNFIFNNDAFGGGGNLTTTVNGNITQNGGTVNLASSGPGSGIVNLKGNYTQTSGTLTESGSSTGSSLNFIGTSAQSLTLAGTASGDRLLLVINNANNGVDLLSDATLPYRLQCTSGDMRLGTKNLIVTEKVLGSRTGGSVVTNGTGALTLKNIDNIGKDFPVAISNASHDAVWITNASGTADFTVRVSATLNPVSNLVVANTLPRQWEITSTSTGANLEFDPDLLAGAQTAPKTISRYTGSTWVATSAAIGANNGYPYAADFTAFTSFVVGTSASIPVELTSFSAKSKNNSNIIEWSTATERNVSHFNIERSTNGRTSWETIGNVKAKGNYQGLSTYNVADDAPLSISYYRLTSIDNDGKTETSKVVSVNRKGDKFALVAVSPIPTTEGVTIDFTVAKRSRLTATITDIVGKIIKTEVIDAVEGHNNVRINLVNIAQGSYMLSLNDGETIATQRILKQ